MSEIPWAHPLEENKDQNDHNLLMYLIESKFDRLQKAERDFQESIEQMKEYERSYYGEDQP